MSGGDVSNDCILAHAGYQFLRITHGISSMLRLWGDVVAWGTTNKATSAEDCCNQCKNFKTDKPDDVQCNGKN